MKNTAFILFIFFLMYGNQAVQASSHSISNSASKEMILQQTPGELEKVPDFESRELKKFAEEYLEFYKAVKKAINDNDYNKVVELQNQAPELTEKVGTIINTGISAEDRDIFVEWTNKLSKSLNN